MSTRSQIGIYENESARIESAGVYLYRHSDGYPESVVPDIKPFLLKFNKGRGIDDTSYCLARLTQYLCDQYDARSKKMWDAMGRTGSVMETESALLGHGIDTALHGDIEFFYHVSPTAIKVYEVTGENPGEWKLKKTVNLAKKLAEYPSLSTPGKTYTVKKAGRKLFCDCPAWFFNKRRDSTCKHTDMASNRAVTVK